jgi:hypothetical protein
VLCGKADRHAHFSDRWSNHLSRAGANIANRKDAGLTGLNQKQAAIKLVPWVSFAQAWRQLWTSEHEPFGVESQESRKPLGAWLGTDENN